jgi:host factor-I protein
MQKSHMKTKLAASPADDNRALPAQHRFLAAMLNSKQTVAVFLANGLKLQGRIVSFDNYAVLIEGEKTDIVYKHAISTIQPVENGGAAARASAPRSDPRPAARDAGQAAPRAARTPTIVVRRNRRRSITGPGE